MHFLLVFCAWMNAVLRGYVKWTKLNRPKASGPYTLDPKLGPLCTHTSSHFMCVVLCPFDETAWWRDRKRPQTRHFAEGHTQTCFVLVFHASDKAPHAIPTHERWLPAVWLKRLGLWGLVCSMVASLSCLLAWSACMLQAIRLNIGWVWPCPEVEQAHLRIHGKI